MLMSPRRALRRLSPSDQLWRRGDVRPALNGFSQDTNVIMPTSIATGAAQPLVSVLIPYYNHSKFLAGCIASVQQQDYPRMEIVVVDDGSAVPAASVLGHVENVAILRTANRGVSAARNTAFKHSSGEFLIFLDADDHLRPGAIQSHVAALQTNPRAGLAFASRRVIDESGAVKHGPHICRPRKDYFKMLLESNPIGSPGAALIRREAFVDAGMFNEAFSMGEDLDLYLRIARRWPVLRHTACVLDYREHSSNTSRALERMLEGTMLLLDSIEPVLTPDERKLLPHARKRWEHTFRPQPTLRYLLRGLYFSFHAMMTVPITYYFRKEF